MNATRPLTRLQDDVLYIVAEHGPVTPREVDSHLNLDPGRSRSVLTALERRALVDATYTQTGGRRAFVVTEKGLALVSVTPTAAWRPVGPGEWVPPSLRGLDPAAPKDHPKPETSL